MNTTLTKLSPYTMSLLGSSPPSLPQVPTLKELRDRTTDLANPNRDIPIPATSAQLQTTLPGYSFSNSPPPEYSRVSANRSWAKLPSLLALIPGEGKARSKMTMKSSRMYASDSKLEWGRQPAIGDIDSNERVRDRSTWKSWVSWMTCRWK